VHLLELKLAFLVFAGIASQWIAWRFKIPAIALLLIVGLIAGPLSGFVVPAEDFGDIYKPAITLAVAIILFEGGLTLNFKEISETSKAVRRIVIIGAPLTWIFGTLAGHYIGGLSWLTATILGAILIVTGPTVIMPLLRQAKLEPRSASLLRWEAIINDPLGALFAVISFELFLVFNNVHNPETLVFDVILALIVAVPGAWLLAKAIVWLFTHGHIPEFLKAPFLLTVVVSASAATNMILEEAGLLTVTVLGVVLANSRMSNLNEMKRFKETVTIILVSAVFILLTASLNVDTFKSFGPQVFGFVLAVLFLVRPLAILIATMNTGTTWQERALVAMIAPRGIVAVAIAGLFGSALIDQGINDGDKILVFTFAVVATTIVLHGFGLPYLAKFLNLKSTETPGVLMIGSTPFTVSLASRLESKKIPCMIVDRNWHRLRRAKKANLKTYYGDVLSEDGHHAINLTNWENVIAATDNDAYNALVCTELAPEIGRKFVFEIGSNNQRHDKDELIFTIGGQPLLTDGLEYSQLNEKVKEGWDFSFVKINEIYTFEQLKKDRPDGLIPILSVLEDGKIQFLTENDTIDEDDETELMIFSKSKAS
jgi:NhaP-type Na+/H+ or K+/H+ antiporter